MTSMNTSRKVLVPLATMLAAGAIAVGSGASFTSTTSNTISAVTAGTLTQTNSKANAAVFSLTNIKPGDTVNGTLKITNSGSLPATFTLKEPTSANGFTANALTLTITDVTVPASPTTVWTGNFGAIADNESVPLKAGASWIAGEARDFKFSVTLDPNADNTEQGKTANATFKWDAVQLAGTTTDQ